MCSSDLSFTIFYLATQYESNHNQLQATPFGLRAIAFTNMANGQWGFTLVWNLTVICSPFVGDGEFIGKPLEVIFPFHECTSIRSIWDVRFTSSPVFVSTSNTLPAAVPSHHRGVIYAPRLCSNPEGMISVQ